MSMSSLVGKCFFGIALLLLVPYQNEACFLVLAALRTEPNLAATTPSPVAILAQQQLEFWLTL